MLPLNGWRLTGSRPSAMTRSTASAPVYSTFARVVSKWVLLGMALPGPPMTENRIFSAARPWWVGMTCRNGKSVWTDSRNAIPRRRPGVRLVAALDAGPLVARHRAGPRIGQQVDHDVLGVDVEQVAAGRRERRVALLDASSAGSARPTGSRNGSMIVFQRSTPMSIGAAAGCRIDNAGPVPTDAA